MVGIISVVIGGHFGGGDHFDGGDHFGGGTRSRTLRSLFTNASRMNSYGSLLLCGHLRVHIINRLSAVSTYVLFNT